jgi:hypothetical protein
MPIVFDEVVGEIAPEPGPTPTAAGDQAGSAEQQVRTLLSALARERWKQRRLDAR